VVTGFGEAPWTKSRLCRADRVLRVHHAVVEEAVDYDDATLLDLTPGSQPAGTPMLLC